MTREAPFTMRNAIAFRVVPPLLFWPIKATLLVAFLAACAGLVVGIRRGGSAAGASLAYCSVAVQANFVLVAAVQTGLPRYALAMWPAVMATAALGVSWAFETTRRAGPTA
jgi:hypothetical protein